jgi:hypothetical protein
VKAKGGKEVVERTSSRFMLTIAVFAGEHAIADIY